MANEFDIEDFDEDDLEDAMEGLDLEDQLEMLMQIADRQANPERGITFREGDIGGVVDSAGYVYSDADPGL